MLQITLITVGSLKEAYWRDAVAEYEKRLGAFCRLDILQLKEARVGNDPSQNEILAALDEEAGRILAAIPPRAYKIAMCVEGTELSSEALATRLESVFQGSSTLCLIIGSSYGLSPRVKQACDMRLSVSKLTLPHQMMRVFVLEMLYRCLGILHGSKYHK